MLLVEMRTCRGGHGGRRGCGRRFTPTSSRQTLCEDCRTQPIPWGLIGKASDEPRMRDDGVLALAAEWVDGHTSEHGFAPGVRSVHYALISLCAAEGLEYRNTRDVYMTLATFSARLRRAGQFPALRDDTRQVARPYFRDDALDALWEEARIVRVDRAAWHEQQVWVALEKRGLLPRVRQWTQRLGLPVIPLGGFASEPIEREVREEIEADGREAVLIIVSDFDPSGLLLAEQFPRNVGVFDEVRRVALTETQIDELGLPEDPAPEEDSRLDWFIETTGRDVQVEVDALDALHPGVLQEAVMDAVNEYVYDEDLDEALDEEWRMRWQILIARQWLAENGGVR